MLGYRTVIYMMLLASNRGLFVTVTASHCMHPEVMEWYIRMLIQKSVTDRDLADCRGEGNATPSLLHSHSVSSFHTGNSF